jgi:hypothetical protein
MTGSDEENHRTSTATLLLNLAGSVCFCAGSIGFIWSTWTIDWLRPFQYGCTIWIMGCILFLLPLLAPLKTRCCHRNAELSTSKSCCWSRSELSLFGCLVCFLVGCTFGTSYSTEETVLRFLPPMNALFLAGSALLFVDSLVVIFWSHRTRTCNSFHKCVVCMCCHGDINDDDNDNNDSAPGCIGLVVAGSYVFAGILGGYGNSQAVIRAGMFGWLVGSIPGLLETIPELYQRCMRSRSCCCQSNSTRKKRVSITRKPEVAQASAV